MKIFLVLHAVDSFLVDVMRQNQQKVALIQVVS